MGYSQGSIHRNALDRRKEKYQGAFEDYSMLYIHAENKTSATEAWDKLNTARDDKGLTRRVSLLCKLVTARLLDYLCMVDHPNSA